MTQGRKPKRNIYVFFHGGCPDGYAAAYAAWKHFGYYWEMIQYTPCYYGYPPPEVKEGSDVYFVDFSYSPEEMESIRQKAHTFKVIDHHKTNQWLAEEDYAIFDLDHSGAYLSYKEFVSDNVPWLIRYVEDRDLWKWELHFGKEITSALSSYRFDEFRDYDALVDEFEHDMNLDYGYDEEDQVQTTRLYEEGVAILRNNEIMVNAICDIADIRTFTVTPKDGGENVYFDNVPVVCAPVLHSDVGNTLLKRHEYAPFSVTYRDNPDGIRSYSLRSMDDRMDVSKICKLAGGGGHRNAGGFEVDLNA